MTERNGNQEKALRMPPTWCSSICRNSMNEVCIERCAVNRDCSGFEVRPNLRLIDMPRFPETKDMTREEKFASVTIYLAKVVDHLQGEKDEPSNPPLRRPNHDSTAGSGLSSNIQSETLLHDLTKTITSHTVGEKRQGKTV